MVVIVVGHMVAVYLAHLRAMALYEDRTLVSKSQLPMLLLMALYTTLSLWIVSRLINEGACTSVRGCRQSALISSGVSTAAMRQALRISQSCKKRRWGIPGKREAGYPVDMARDEVLDTLGESRKAIELLDRHVPGLAF